MRLPAPHLEEQGLVASVGILLNLEINFRGSAGHIYCINKRICGPFLNHCCMQPDH